jgi:hypothetical protein
LTSPLFSPKPRQQTLTTADAAPPSAVCFRQNQVTARADWFCFPHPRPSGLDLC